VSWLWTRNPSHRAGNTTPPKLNLPLRGSDQRKRLTLRAEGLKSPLFQRLNAVFLTLFSCASRNRRTQTANFRSETVDLGLFFTDFLSGSF
jgi:hypothetical protein